MSFHPREPDELKDLIIKRANARLRMLDPRLHWDEHERLAPVIHTLVETLVEVVLDEVERRNSA